MRSKSFSGKKTKNLPGESLCLRMRKHQNDVLRFMNDFDVPFTNNQAEQDIRMCKVRQKISGCFRSTTGPEIFCRIRGYLSTARKQGINIMEAITNAIQGNPFTFPT
jgi:transposase